MLKKIAIGLTTVASYLMLMPGMVMAGTAEGASFLPGPLQELIDTLTANPGDTITSRIRLGLMIGLGAIILVAIVFSMIAAFKYISSQGDETKVVEAKKAVQSILVGVAVLFISIIGIFLIFTFFGVSSPDAGLCEACIDDNPDNDDICDTYISTGEITAACDIP
ncbi:MAG TPA: hypothetical protein ENI23_10710 [bacterium]|nr:hypothetical protein [bacterium]